MQIKTIKVKVSDLTRNYVDNGEDGVFTYNDQNDPQALLVCRPAYQREFVYSEKEEQDLITSIMNEYPIGVFYWATIPNDPDYKYEILDGQQRTISICRYVVDHSFSVDKKFFSNLTDDERKQILDYEITVNICSGTDSEKLAWFKIINKSGEPLTKQELANAVYAGPWLTEAKLYFSRPNGPAVQMSDKWINTGKVIRQDLLEKALKYICYRDDYKDVEQYMAKHQQDKDAQDLWLYYQDILAWEKKLFPKTQSKLLVSQDWGKLYHEYNKNTYNPIDLQNDIDALVLDDDVTSTSGIVPYVLSERTVADQKHLNIRGFSRKQMLKKYQEQGGICPICKKHYEFKEMAGDHIVPWSKGGHTEYSNLQMLCKHDNEVKSNNLLDN